MHNYRNLTSTSWGMNKIRATQTLTPTHSVLKCPHARSKMDKTMKANEQNYYSIAIDEE